MCLHSEPVPAVPEATARVARAAFPRGNPYLRLREAFPTLFTDAQFKSLFPAVGQPAEAPWRLALVTLLQFAEGLSDRQAAEAVRGRIDWKYLLGLPLEDPGFDASVLCEFRGRLLQEGAEALLFETLLTHCREQGLVKARGKQRTDSTHVLAAIRVLNRLELVGESMRKALEALATAAPEWLTAHCPAEWAARYGKRFEQYRLPKREAEREALAVTIGEDIFRLLSALGDAAEPKPADLERRQLPALLTLRQVWLQQYEREGDTVRLRPSDELPGAADSVNSPHDPQARYSRKRDVEWVGSKMHLTESCDADRPLLITDVQTTAAPVPDSEVLPKVHQALALRGLLPGTHYVDAGYTQAGLLVSSQREYGVRLVGPVEEDTSWQARAQAGFAARDFQVDWQAEQVRCPAGKQSAGWRETEKHGHRVIQVHFRLQDCQACPYQPQCTRAQRANRKLTLLPQEQYLALQTARAWQRTPEFAQEYAARAGVEGAHSQAVRRMEARHSRYTGDPKVRLEHLMIAAALNLVRVAEWLGEPKRRPTRQSPLRILTPAAVGTC